MKDCHWFQLVVTLLNGPRFGNCLLHCFKDDLEPKLISGHRRERPPDALLMTMTIWLFRCRPALEKLVLLNCVFFAVWRVASVLFHHPLRALSAQTEATLSRTLGRLGKQYQCCMAALA